MNDRRSLVLVVTGSIAATKTIPLLEALHTKNFDVSVILTHAPEAFGWVSCDKASAVSGHDVLTASSSEEEKRQRIEAADVVFIAPASADFLSQLAYQSTPLARAIIESMPARHVAIAPAMNIKMWEYPAVQRNATRLHDLGAIILGPVSGALACGDQGFGRFAAVETLACGITAIMDGTQHEALTLYDKARNVKATPPPIIQNGHLLVALGGKADDNAVHALVTSIKKADLSADYVLDPLWTERAETLTSIIEQPIITNYGQVSGLGGVEHIRLPERAGCVVFPFLDDATAQKILRGDASSLFLALTLASKVPLATTSACFASLEPELAQRLREDGWRSLDDVRDLLPTKTCP